MKQILSFVLLILIVNCISCTRHEKTHITKFSSHELTQKDTIYSLFPLYNKGLTLLLEDYERMLKKNKTERGFYPYLLTLLNEFHNHYTLDDTLRYSYQSDTLININRHFYEGHMQNYFWSSKDLIYIDYDDYILHGGTLIYSFEEECLDMLKKWERNKFMTTYNPDSNAIALDSYDDYISRIVIKDGLIVQLDTMKVMHANYKKENIREKNDAEKD